MMVVSWTRPTMSWLLTTTTVVVMVVVCGGAAQDQQQLEDLVTTASSAGLTSLVEWLRIAGLDTVLKESGPYTLFAPTNEAFSKLPPTTIWKLKSDDKFLENILRYNMAPGAFTSRQFTPGGNITSLQGEAVSVAVERNQPAITFKVRQQNADATILRPDVTARNGVLHIVDTVLVPPTLQEEPNLEMVLRAAGNVNTFLGLVEEAGMLDVIRDGGPLTVFGPTDAAFRRVDPSILRQLRREPRLLKAVILSHLVQKDLSSFELRTTTVHENSLGELIIFRTINNIVLVNTARVLQEDLVAKNGALHVIDGLLLPSINALGSQGPPPRTNMLAKMRQAGLTIFAGLIKTSGIFFIVQSGGPLTIFAPSNKAMSQMPRAEVQKLVNSSNNTYLRLELLRHILAEEVRTSDIRADMLKMNFGEQKTRLNHYRRPAAGDVYTANGVPLVVVDERATNGVLHILSSVLPSAADDALTVMQRDGRFSTFIRGVQAADLIKPLRSDGHVTIFAATNAAFSALPQEEFFAILLDLSKLSSMISRHVVSSNGTDQTLFSPGLCWNSFKAAGGQMMRTAMGKDGQILLTAGRGRVARIIETDLVASNGVVHVVDSLL